MARAFFDSVTSILCVLGFGMLLVNVPWGLALITLFIGYCFGRMKDE